MTIATGIPDNTPPASVTPAAGAAPAADDFGAAFDQYTGGGDGAAGSSDPAAGGGAAGGADGGAGMPEAPASEPAPAAAPAGEGAAAAGEDGGQAAAAAPAAAPEGAPTQEPSPAELLKQLQGIVEQSKQAPAAPAAPAAQEPPAQEPAAQPQEVPQYTADEQKLIAEYQNNWPDVSKAEALLRRGEYASMMQYIFSEVAKYVGPALEGVRSLTNDAHLQQLAQTVPDYSPQLEQDVTAWISTQPAYLQPAYQHVMQNGTTEEVADLIGRFRSASGQQVPAPAAAQTPAGGQAAPAATPPKPVKNTELSSAARQAVASLAPVGSERSQVTATQEGGDFDSAFARYAASMSGS